MGDEERKPHCSQKELPSKLWVMKEDSLFTKGVTLQTMGNEGRLIVQTRSYNANNW
ncbi:hypothetical protein KSS87_001912 [Heliosperma pusillum]|nr:hypothetical protein KSS87_001912 [Heliosperma pusillum]